MYIDHFMSSCWLGTVGDLDMDKARLSALKISYVMAGKKGCDADDNDDNISLTFVSYRLKFIVSSFIQPFEPQIPHL